MRLRQYAIALLVPLIHACAATPPEAPRIARLESGKTEGAVTPEPARTLSLDEIVALTQTGIGADALIARIGNARHPLAAAQIVDLAKRGVDAKVLDHLLQNERRATHDEIVGESARRERACLERLEQESRHCQPAFNPMWRPGYPFGNCWPPRPGLPYWRCL